MTGAGGKRVPSEDPADEKLPVFTGGVQPDISFFGFDVTRRPSRRSRHRHPGYYVVIQQHPTEPRFGLDTDAWRWAPPAISRLPASRPSCRSPAQRLQWGLNAAHMAGITRRLPGAAGDPRLAILHRDTDGAAPMTATATLCPGDLPLVLLPVRLETRFFTLPGNVTELRVRVYPDKIHLDSHEPDLLPDRARLGRALLGAGLARRQRRRRRAPPPGGSSPTGSAPSAPPGSRACCSRPIRSQRPTAPVPADQPLPIGAGISGGDGGDGWPGFRLASRAAGAAAARSLDRRAAIRQPPSSQVVGARHRAAARGRSGPESAGAATVARRPVADRSRHEMDGRLRRGRSQGHGAAHHRAARRA